MNDIAKNSVNILNILRGPKIVGVALFDLSSTALGAYILSNFLTYLGVFKTSTTLILFILLVILAIGTHYVLGIPTMLNYYLGINTLGEVMVEREKRGETL
jgi:hypothetical protein